MLDSHCRGDNARIDISHGFSRLCPLRFADSFGCADAVVTEVLCFENSRCQGSEIHDRNTQKDVWDKVKIKTDAKKTHLFLSFCA